MSNEIQEPVVSKTAKLGQSVFDHRAMLGGSGDDIIINSFTNPQTRITFPLPKERLLMPISTSYVC